MKRILILTILLMSSLAWAGSTTVVVGQVSSGAGGGPDAWYYAGGSDSYSANGNTLEVQGFAAPITIASGGSITKVSVKIHDATNSINNYKIGVYTGTSGAMTLQQCATFQIPSSTSAGWYDYTLPTAITISASTIYCVLHCTGDSATYEYNETGGYWIFDTYANACQASEASDGDDYLPAVRVYVD